MAHCAPIAYANNVVYAEYVTFLLTSLEFWYIIGRRHLANYFPIKTPGTEFLAGCPGRRHPWWKAFTLLQLSTGGMKCILFDSTWEGLLGVLCLFPPDFAMCALSSADFALNSFAIHNQQYDHPMSSESSSFLCFKVRTCCILIYLAVMSLCLLITEVLWTGL